MRTEQRPSSISLAIEGLHCASCVSRLERALCEVEGVTEASVNLATGRATVAGRDPEPAALAEAVERAGYTARPDGEDRQLSQARLAVEGMHCASCVAKIENSLRSTEGVTDASVNLATGEATVDRTIGSLSSVVVLNVLPPVRMSVDVSTIAVGLVQLKLLD